MSNYEKCKGCPYYYGEIDNCMYGEPDVRTNASRKCAPPRLALYRAKGVEEKDKDVWYEGSYYFREKATLAALYDTEERHIRDKLDNEQHFILFDGFSDWCLPKPHYKADINPSTLCQYIGRDDVKKQRIFERDIVKCSFEYADLRPFEATQGVGRPEFRNAVGTVVYDKSRCAFVIRCKNESGEEHIFCFDDAFTVEVIGNEIDSPDWVWVE